MAILSGKKSIWPPISAAKAQQFKQIFTQGIKNWDEKSLRILQRTRKRDQRNGPRRDRECGYSLGLNTIAPICRFQSLPGEVLEVLHQSNITKVEETGKDPKVYVSRVHRDIVKRLFETLIPEVASGVIEVMAVARDAGYRSKVGVISNNPDVDPKGSCVGPQGMRVKQINQALNGERIDIFVWSDDAIRLIAEALTPANVQVLPDPEEKKATVIVPDSQFSLAIGKGGQNARLASQATGWKIDIKDESTAYQEGIKFKINVLNK